MPLNHEAQASVNFFSRPRASREQRKILGEHLREQVPLESHALLPAPEERADALSILRAQESDREPTLVPLRYERMSQNPFAYLRGAAAVMAHDLSLRPTSGIEVQLCGDAHLANFGMFASQERSLVFDLNDFDETAPGPFEWDVKRLAASFALAARNNGLSRDEQFKACTVAAQSYREWMAAFSERKTLDLWFAKVDVKWMMSQMKNSDIRKMFEKASEKAKKKTVDSAVDKLTEVVDGQRRFRADPPLLTPIDDLEIGTVVEALAPVFTDYIQTLQPDRAVLLSRYSFKHLAFKVVGVGSVGTRAYVMLLESGDGEPLILQAKQAGASVLEPYVGESVFANSGERVVVGTRLMQATGDPFLGWCHGGPAAPHDFYFRQLWDMKGSIDVAKLDLEGVTSYARICGAVLARAHARAGDASFITGYLGSSKTFDHAIAEYALGYADISEQDYQQLLTALALK
jgi:uncharacterized protein (DUF2252 family)